MKAIVKLKLRHQIPNVYSKLLPPEILDFSLNETKATCGDCAMTVEKRGPRARITYQGHLKCCTFEPMLPNFLVGALLKEKPSLQLQIKINDGVPLALLPTTDYRNRFSARKKTDFGQREDLLCGYYDREKQNCSIWKNRGSVCTTFFCQSDLGDQGKRFWSLFGEYLHHVEMCLAEEALVHLDFSPRQVSEQLDVMVPLKRVKEIPTATRRRLWNGYQSEEFYLKAADWVQNLTRDQMPEILGDMGLKKQNKVIGQIRRIEDRRAHGAS